MNEYEKKLKEQTLATFKDKPEEVTELWCDYVDHDKIMIAWKKPEDNNV